MARSTKNALTMSYSNLNKYSDAKTNESKSQSSDGLSGGCIVGIIIGVFVALFQ